MPGQTRVNSCSLLIGDPLASSKVSSSSKARVPNSIGTPSANNCRRRNSTRKRPDSNDASAAERFAPSSVGNVELVMSKFSVLLDFRTSMPFAVRPGLQDFGGCPWTRAFASLSRGDGNALKSRATYWARHLDSVHSRGGVSSVLGFECRGVLWPDRLSPLPKQPPPPACGEAKGGSKMGGPAGPGPSREGVRGSKDRQARSA
jgi:hypothetical protein